MAEGTTEVYKKFYQRLVEADLPTEKLIEEFQRSHLFTDGHVLELENCDSQTEKIGYLLDNVVNLESCDTNAFSILLKVMEESDATELSLLAKEMKITCNLSPPSDNVETTEKTTEKFDSNYCTTHDDKLMNLSCETCDDWICEECRLIGHQDHTVLAKDEADGKVKDFLSSVAGAVFPKSKKKERHNQDDATSVSNRSPSPVPPNIAHNYGNIKQHLLIINKYGPINRRLLELGSPWLLAKGADDSLFVRDHRTHQVIVFDHRLKFSHIIGNNGELKSIGGIAVNDDASVVYVADQQLHCVKKFKLDGQYITQIGHKGTSDGEFRSPCGLLQSGTESLFVCDSGNHRIQVFHHNDRFAYSFGQHGADPGSFDTPEAIALNSSENMLFISSDNKVQVFTTSGKFIKVFGNFSGISHKLVTPTGVCCTKDGHVLVCSYGTHCVFVFKEDGTFVSVIKGAYQGKERLVFPAGVLVRDNGNIVVASSGNHQLVVF